MPGRPSVPPIGRGTRTRLAPMGAAGRQQETRRERHWLPVRAAAGRVVRRATVAGRPLPRFLILGAQKSGTSSLHAYLAEHPRIAPAFRKEVHYFDLQSHKSLASYRARFPHVASDVLCMEASPYYLMHPQVPHRVAATLPDARFVVLLRNPIDRAVSQHNHELVLGFENRPLEEALEAEESRLLGQRERMECDPRYQSFSYAHHSYVERGKYADQLERWFGHVDRSRFLIVQAERLFEAPADVVAETQEFLGLPIDVPAGLEAHNARRYAPIAPQLRAELRARFEPHNERLYELLGVDYGWR